jgi:hypothetical protein
LSPPLSVQSNISAFLNSHARLMQIFPHTIHPSLGWTSTFSSFHYFHFLTRSSSLFLHTCPNHRNRLSLPFSVIGAILASALMFLRLSHSVHPTTGLRHFIAIILNYFSCSAFAVGSGLGLDAHPLRMGTPLLVRTREILPPWSERCSYCRPWIPVHGLHQLDQRVRHSKPL